MEQVIINSRRSVKGKFRFRKVEFIKLAAAKDGIMTEMLVVESGFLSLSVEGGTVIGRSVSCLPSRR